MSNKRVLVIDDEQIVLQSVSKILTHEGFVVDVASNGRDGIRRATSQPYDIVLTDIRMPEVDGLEVLRDIKRSCPSVPVLIITGYAAVQSAVRAMKLGAANYLEKPFTPDQLIQMVKQALDAAAGVPPEELTLIHRNEVLKVLKKGAFDPALAKELFEHGAEALEKYDLTKNEKLAILTADIDWIEDHMGTIDQRYKQWLVDLKKLLNTSNPGERQKEGK